MSKRILITAGFFFSVIVGFSQENPKDSSINSLASIVGADSLDDDALMDELISFMDSLLKPKSYLLTSVSAANGLFNYNNKNNTRALQLKKIVVTPTVGYYHKAGPGITFSGNMMDNDGVYTLFQYSISPSFDFVRNRNWIAGIAYVRYFTKDSLSFYTTPLQNEFNAYFVWRQSWLQPSIAAAYGWGSRSDYQKRERFLQLLQNATRITSIISSTKTEESITDFAITASVRHNFYWPGIFRFNDYIRLTPQLSFSSGSQQFGFNQVTGVYGINARNGAAVLYNSGSANLDHKLKFQPLSMTVYIRPEYAIGKFFIQPQLILDYYFPAVQNNLTTLFSVNTGFMF